MQLSQISPLREGITHIEDLGVQEFLDALYNFEKFEISEKIDGSNLQFGYDEQGFYTSRETKGDAPRLRSENDYEKEYNTTFQRSAHLALEKAAPSLLKSGHFKQGDAVEVEVLYGVLPNAVPYNEGINRIIFLRPTNGNPNLKGIAATLDGKKTNVQLSVPFTLDGKTQKYRNELQWWEFAQTPTVDGEAFSKSGEFAELKVKLKEFEQFLKADSGIGKFSNAEVIALPLNKRPGDIDVADWKELKLEVKEVKKKFYHVEEGKPSGFKWEIKEILLNNLVRKIQSGFGPEIANGGWIEGVVFRNKDTNEMFKVVDKDMFMVIKDFLWQVRADLKDAPKSLNNVNTFTGKLKVGLATALGHAELGTTQAKRYMKKHGSTPDEIIANLSKDTNFDSTKTYWIKFLQNMQGEFDKILDKYQKERKGKELQINDRTIKYDEEVHSRTLQTFNVMNKMLESMLRETTQANSITDLYTLLVGRQLSSL